ncbi:hypothetical protein [Flavobacterium lindanitolerans]|uniref:hypothetical protein n=1 Tax=Flavobacterium lindanitolerans TaxID=428988 RepID=UPI0027BAD70B|nr:hypothetical protein [Flavobacterium lindanitolerans]
MKKFTVIILLIITGLVLSNCNKDDDNTRDMGNAIVGTWKLVEEYTDGNVVSLSSCALQENYIFGSEQFTHEIYSNSSRRMSSHDDDDNGDDNSDDNSDDNNDDNDDNSDDNNDDNVSDDNSDDNDDDDNGTGECLMSEQKIGFWTAQDTTYILTIDGVSENLTIHFTDGNNRFYYEKTVTINGVSRVKRYVFQRQ